MDAEAPSSGPPSPGSARSDPVPELSVVVPTANRPDSVERLLRALAAQTIAPARYEVLLTDDGSEPPVAPRVAQMELPFRVECNWQPRRGPAAARNRAIAKARAPILLILNDDAGPPPDLLERHLAAHRRSPSPRAWLGEFPFAPECSTPLAIALTRLQLLFPFEQMRRDGPNPGLFFWTCNLSVPRQAVLDAGGFDEEFERPICEDVELGYRLAKRGVAVHFLADAACLHHHQVDAVWFERRQLELGRHMVKLWRRHRDPLLLPWIRATRGDEELLALALESRLRTDGRAFRATAREIDAIDRAAPLSEAAEVAAAAATLLPRVRAVNDGALRLGLLAGLRGWTAPAAWGWLDALPERSRAAAPSAPAAVTR
jgi:GT2 family glycosyltransferase